MRFSGGAAARALEEGPNSFKPISRFKIHIYTTIIARLARGDGLAARVVDSVSVVGWVCMFLACMHPWQLWVTDNCGSSNEL